MSDERLRELERRWEETGAVEDEVPYLRERVRAGELTESQLELLAYCGDQAALAIVGLAEVPPEEFKSWIMGLLRFKRLGSRAACALAFCLAHMRGGEVTEKAEEARQAGLAWINCPCKKHGDEAVRLADEVAYEVKDTLSGYVASLHAVKTAVCRQRRQCVKQAWTVACTTAAPGEHAVPLDTRAPVVKCSLAVWVKGGILRLEPRGPA